MAVATVKARHTVKPCAATWTGTMSLSEWDQIGIITHVRTIYLYKPPYSKNNNIDAIFERLRVSLSQTLVHFYPLSGRLRWIGAGRRLALDCNETGVQFIEAESDWKLEDFGDFSPSLELQGLTPDVDYVNVPINEIPLLLVQVTSFKCGGISIGVTVSHVIVDGQAASHFISEWARIARGQPLAIPPFLDREVIIVAGQNYKPISQFDQSKTNRLPILIGKMDNAEEREKKTTLVMLKLTQVQVETLKKMANEDRKSTTCSDRAYTRFETVTAHIWKCACKAREHASDQETGIVTCVDSRNRMNPPLPQKYFGTATFNVTARARSGDLISSSLSYGSSKIREAIHKVTDEYVCSALSFFQGQEDLSKFQDLQATGTTKGRSFHGNPNIDVTSWLTLPIHGVDFGWGKEIYMGSADTHCVDGGAYILPNRDGDGSLTVSLCLQIAHIEKFKNFFYQDIILSM